jgi:hypothetical protein
MELVASVYLIKLPSLLRVAALADTRYDGSWLKKSNPEVLSRTARRRNNLPSSEFS